MTDNEPKKDVFKNKRKRRTFTDKSRFYIDKDEYEVEIIKYKKVGKASERLGELFLLHVQRCSSAGNWKSYTYRGDMEGMALIHLLKYSHNYNPNFTMPDEKTGLMRKGAGAFSYCTSIIQNAFRQVLAKEKKQSTIKDALIKNQDRINNNKLTLTINDDQPSKD
jgi:hypothetical protein